MSGADLFVLGCALLLTILQFLDFATTYILISKHGGRELNPVVKWFMDKLGMEVGLLLMKGGAVVLVWYGVNTGLFATAFGMGVMAALSVLYIAVVINNAKQIKG